MKKRVDGNAGSSGISVEPSGKAMGFMQFLQVQVLRVSSMLMETIFTDGGRFAILASTLPQ